MFSKVIVQHIRVINVYHLKAGYISLDMSFFMTLNFPTSLFSSLTCSTIKIQNSKNQFPVQVVNSTFPILSGDHTGINTFSSAEVSTPSSSKPSKFALSPNLRSNSSYKFNSGLNSVSSNSAFDSSNRCCLNPNFDL